MIGFLLFALICISSAVLMMALVWQGSLLLGRGLDRFPLTTIAAVSIVVGALLWIGQQIGADHLPNNFFNLL